MGREGREDSFYIVKKLMSYLTTDMSTSTIHMVRMYGALTGLSKQMVAQRHGPETLKKWRRGYATRPPPISSFSASYPGTVKYSHMLCYTVAYHTMLHYTICRTMSCYTIRDTMPRLTLIPLIVLLPLLQHFPAYLPFSVPSPILNR